MSLYELHYNHPPCLWSLIFKRFSLSSRALNNNFFIKARLAELLKEILNMLNLIEFYEI